MLTVLVAEDEMYIRDLITKNLEKHGYNILQADDGKKGYDLFLENHVDLIISDIMMPHTDGITLVKKIRQLNEDIPVIMLTALDTFQDKEKGFTSGADDYIVKPVDMNELILRVKAHLRRYKIISESQFTHKSIFLDYSKNICRIKNENIDLTVKEFQLFFKLMASSGRIFTREQLMNEIWGYDSESYERTVDTHIKRLREKIKTKDFELVTVRGLGYKVVLT
jgi:two-component system OmpR family response regulator